MILKNERKDVQKTFDQLLRDELRVGLVDRLDLADLQDIVHQNEKALAYAGKVLLVEVGFEGGKDLVDDSCVLVCFGVVVDYLVGFGAFLFREAVGVCQVVVDRDRDQLLLRGIRHTSIATIINSQTHYQY